MEGAKPWPALQQSSSIRFGSPCCAILLPYLYGRPTTTTDGQQRQQQGKEEEEEEARDRTIRVEMREVEE